MSKRSHSTCLCDVTGGDGGDTATTALPDDVLTLIFTHFVTDVEMILTLLYCGRPLYRALQPVLVRSQQCDTFYEAPLRNVTLSCTIEAIERNQMTRALRNAPLNQWHDALRLFSLLKMAHWYSLLFSYFDIEPLIDIRFDARPSLAVRAHAQEARCNDMLTQFKHTVLYAMDGINASPLRHDYRDDRYICDDCGSLACMILYVTRHWDWSTPAKQCERATEGRARCDRIGCCHGCECTRWQLCPISCVCDCHVLELQGLSPE